MHLELTSDNVVRYIVAVKISHNVHTISHFPNQTTVTSQPTTMITLNQTSNEDCRLKNFANLASAIFLEKKLNKNKHT
jgi:hypothetical protein